MRARSQYLFCMKKVKLQQEVLGFVGLSTFPDHFSFFLRKMNLMLALIIFLDPQIPYKSIKMSVITDNALEKTNKGKMQVNMDI